MTGFLKSLKADLADRRMVPLVAVALALLVGAIAYAVLGGSSSTAPTSASVPSTATEPTGGLAVTQASPQTQDAVAETTDGTSLQLKGKSRNPFKPLPGSTSKATSASTGSTESSGGSGSTGSSGSSGSSSESGSTSSGGSSGESSGGTESGSSKPKTKTVYHVTGSFGEFPEGATVETVKLTPFDGIKLMAPLPATGTPLLAFRGVTAGGKSATFTVVGEAILHGQGSCLPSAVQCQAVDLKPGQSEQLEYLAPGATTIVTYELRVTKITSTKVTATAARVDLTPSKKGERMLRAAHLMAIPDLRPASQAGVLVFVHSGAKAARAHSAKHH